MEALKKHRICGFGNDIVILDINNDEYFILENGNYNQDLEKINESIGELINIIPELC